VTFCSYFRLALYCYCISAHALARVETRSLAYYLNTCVTVKCRTGSSWGVPGRSRWRSIPCTPWGRPLV